MGNIGSMGLKKMYAGKVKIKQAYLGADKVFSAGNIVTYKVDTGVIYAEEVDCDATCLSPGSFIPAKDGYTFLGWREDNTASDSVLTEKVMGDEPITLYAVFKKAVKLTYHTGSISKPTGTTTKYKMYNNGNTSSPIFEFTSVEYSGYTFRGWTTEAKANATVVYEAGKSYTLESDVTVYTTWQKTVTLSYNGNGATGGSVETQNGTMYVLCGGSSVGATFILAANGFTKTDYVFKKWALNGASGTQYAPGESYTATSNVVMYAVWEMVRATVYDATYSYTGDYLLTLDSENVNNAVCVTTATKYEVKAGQGTAPPYTASGTGTVLSLTTQAINHFDYADVVLYVHGYTNYGDIIVKVNNETIITSAYTAVNQKEEITVTLPLSEKATIEAYVSATNRSSNANYMAFGEVAVKSVTLYK